MDNDNECIVYNDISSQYPFELSRELPYKDYKFVEEFDETKYGNDFGCIMYCEVKATDKIKNDYLFKQNPMLVSKCLITDKNSSEYQLNQIKEKGLTKYNSVSKKLISNLGNDSNAYLNFEMYQIMKEAGYNIVVKKYLNLNKKQYLKSILSF